MKRFLRDFVVGTILFIIVIGGLAAIYLTYPP